MIFIRVSETYKALIATANLDTRVSSAVILMNVRLVTMIAMRKPCAETQWVATTVLATRATKARVRHTFQLFNLSLNLLVVFQQNYCSGFYCADIDECNEEPCHMDAECNNDAGSFSCSCKNGFSGDGHECQDINECFESPCDINAHCANVAGIYTCSCFQGKIYRNTERQLY